MLHFKNLPLHLQIFYLFFLLLIQQLSYGQEIENPEFKTLLKERLSHSVNEIDVKKAYSLIDSAIFLDAREKSEYDVSHIKNAQWVGYNSFKFSRISHIPKNKLIIIYCSIGYRSEKITEKLLKKGYTSVYNLYGGIFEWSNQSYPMYRGNIKTQDIHGYNKNWSKWITEGDITY